MADRRAENLENLTSAAPTGSSGVTRTREEARAEDTPTKATKVRFIKATPRWRNNKHELIFLICAIFINAQPNNTRIKTPREGADNNHTGARSLHETWAGSPFKEESHRQEINKSHTHTNNHIQDPQTTPDGKARKKVSFDAMDTDNKDQEDTTIRLDEFKDKFGDISGYLLLSQNTRIENSEDSPPTGQNPLTGQALTGKNCGRMLPKSSLPPQKRPKIPHFGCFPAARAGAWHLAGTCFRGWLLRTWPSLVCYVPRFRAVGRTGCARANAAAPTPPGASAWILADASVDAGVWLSASTPSIDALANVDVDFPAAREMKKEYNRMLRGQRAASMRGGCTYPNHPPHPHHYPIIGFRPRAREGRLLRTSAISRHLSTGLK